MLNFAPVNMTHFRLEDLKKGLWVFSLFALCCLFFLFPEAAFANTGSVTPSFAGDFTNKEVNSNITKSFQFWWKDIAVWSLFIALIWAVYCVLFREGRGWQASIVVVLLVVFGELIVRFAMDNAGLEQKPENG